MLIPFLGLDVPNEAVWGLIGAAVTQGGNVVSNHFRDRSRSKSSDASRQALESTNFRRDLQEEIRQLRIEVGGLKGEIHAGQQEMTTWRERCFTLIEENGKLRADVAHHKAEIAQLRMYIDDLRERGGRRAVDRMPIPPLPENESSETIEG